MKWARWILSLLALGVVLYLFWPMIGELGEAMDLFHQASWIWLPAILIIQLISYSSLTWLNALSLQSFPGKIAFSRLMALLASMAFIETAIPSAGTSGIILRNRLLRRHGRFPPEASMFSLGVETVYELLAVVTVSLIGLYHLMELGNLSTARIAGIILLMLGLVGTIGAGWRIIGDHKRINSWIQRFTGLWNRLIGRYSGAALLKPIDSQHLEKRLAVFQASLIQLRKTPSGNSGLLRSGRSSSMRLPLELAFIYSVIPLQSVAC